MDARAWDARYLAEPELWGEPSRIVAPFVDRRPGVAVDLACGNGRHTTWLTGLGWQATGVDFSAAAIDQARRRTPDARWVVADALHWEPDQPLDLVFVAYLHLPVEQIRPLLRRCLGWLTAGGRLVHLCHAHDNLRHGVGGPQDPRLLPRAVDLAAAVHAAGPDVLVHRLQHVRRPTEAGAAVDLLLVADRIDAPGSA